MKRAKGKSERAAGIGLIEVSIALLIFLIALLTLAQALTISLTLNRKTREILIANTLCKDKLEQLLSLDFDDIATDTTVAPTGGPPLLYPATGRGLTDGGSIAPDPPAIGYVDYVDTIGNRVAAASLATNRSIIFTRQWSIETVGNVKTIRVTVNTPSTYGLITESSQVAFKSRSQ